MNHFFHAEGDAPVREFRAPLGAMVIRRNRRGQAMTALSGLVYHRCAFVNSLMLCLVNVCGVSLCVGWLPLFVTFGDVSAAMPNMRRRQLDSMRAYSEDGWSFAQVYWAAIWTLYHAGCIDGEVHRMSPGHDSSPIPVWHTEAAADALALGFIDSVAFLSLSFLCRLTLSMGTEVGLWQFDDARRRLRLGLHPLFHGESTWSPREHVVHARVLRAGRPLHLLSLWRTVDEAHHILDPELFLDYSPVLFCHLSLPSLAGGRCDDTSPAHRWQHRPQHV